MVQEEELHVDHNANEADINRPAGYWDYSRSYGPHIWEKIFKAGDKQSPIDIATAAVVYDEELARKPLTLTRSGIQLNLINSGINVAARALEGQILPLNGGPLSFEYAFREVHFHWGRTPDITGAEHTIDGKRYSVEMHLVHWNHQAHASFYDAVHVDSGLTGLAVFFDEGDYPPNEALSNMLDLFEKVSYKNQEHSTPHKFDPYSLLPQSIDKYYTYPGSITFPPLSETVTWIILAEPMQVPTAQVDRLRNLKSVSFKAKDDPNLIDVHDHLGCACTAIPTIGNNFREVMPLKNRQVRSSFS